MKLPAQIINELQSGAGTASELAANLEDDEQTVTKALHDLFKANKVQRGRADVTGASVEFLYFLPGHRPAWIPQP